MDYENLKKLVMKQAEEKGFGTKPDDIIVSEKIVLIHSEISEAYEAYLANNLEGKDGFYEELGDVLQRTLHLGGIYAIDFSQNSDFDSAYLSSVSLDGKIARLHKITSDAWESYRHKKIDAFKDKLIDLAYSLNQVSLENNFSLEDAVLKKLYYNKNRDWNKERINEKFT